MGGDQPTSTVTGDQTLDLSRSKISLTNANNNIYDIEPDIGPDENKSAPHKTVFISRKQQIFIKINYSNNLITWGPQLRLLCLLTLNE